MWIYISGLLGLLLGFALAGAVAFLRSRHTQQSPTPDLPEWFYWLADAPMFIDDRLVSFFYDAVLRPKHRTVQIALTKEQTSTATQKTSFSAKAMQVIPGLAQASIGGEISSSEAVKRGESTLLEPIENAPRKLIELTLHYLDRYYPEGSGDPTENARIWIQTQNPREFPWESPARSVIEKRPRMLAFLDFPKGTKFVPMAAETDEGVCAVYKKLVETLRGVDGEACPSYPSNPEDPEFYDKTNKYWRWFDKHWNSMTALEILEAEMSGSGRPRWVNYRVPVQDNLTLHLNVIGYGNYDIGAYAYSLIRRGYRHGVRVVGTVRSEPGLNVMAIYDK